ncbi:hypothetical protein TNCV_3952861 [Trichonephila clavipes]|nr:hypothetical protein TNCV_3952861 [Trichonephila clavipes]
MELHRRRGKKDSLATSLADPHIFKTNGSIGIHTPVNGYNKWFPEDDPYLPHLEKMVSLTCKKNYLLMRCFIVQHTISLSLSFSLYRHQVSEHKNNRENGIRAVTYDTKVQKRDWK